MPSKYELGTNGTVDRHEKMAKIYGKAIQMLKTEPPGINIGTRVLNVHNIYGAESGVHEYVYFNDASQSLFKEFYEIVNHSPTLSAIINSMRKLIIGDGVSIVTPGFEKTDPPEFFESCNAGEDHIEYVLNEFVDFYLKTGTAFLELTKVDKSGGKAFSINCLPNEFCAMTRPKEGGRVKVVGVMSEDDYENGFDETRAKPIRVYPEWTEDEDNEGVQRSIMFLTNKTAGTYAYGTPPWMSVAKPATTEKGFWDFNAYEVYNGFTPRALLQIFGSYTEEEAEAIIEGIEDTFTGPDGSRVYVLVSRQSKELAESALKTMDTKQDGSYMDMIEHIQKAIISGMEYSPAVAGIAISGQLGNTQQIRNEFERVQNTVIRPENLLIRKRILQKVFDEWVKHMGVVKFAGAKVDFLNLTPISYFGDVNIENVIEKWELREALGYPPEPEKKDNTNGTNTTG